MIKYCIYCTGPCNDQIKCTTCDHRGCKSCVEGLLCKQCSTPFCVNCSIYCDTCMAISCDQCHNCCDRPCLEKVWTVSRMKINIRIINSQRNKQKIAHSVYQSLIKIRKKNTHAKKCNVGDAVFKGKINAILIQCEKLFDEEMRGEHLGDYSI